MFERFKIGLTIDLTKEGLVSITRGEETFSEPAVVAMSEDGEKVIAAGMEATGFGKLYYPIKESVIVDFSKAEGLFRHLIRKVVGGHVWCRKISATILVKLPLEMLELRALNDALEYSGVGKIKVVAVDENGKPIPWLS